MVKGVPQKFNTLESTVKGTKIATLNAKTNAVKK